MGCNNQKPKSDAKISASDRIQSAIDSNDEYIIETTIKSLSINIDDVFLCLNRVHYSPLAYALWKGKSVSFNFILTVLNANFVIMEKILMMQSISPLLLAGSHGNLELFSLYLPLYLKNAENSSVIMHPKSRSTVSLNEGMKSSESYLTIVQQTCSLNYLHMLSYIVKYSKSLETVPFFLDVNDLNEDTGENCAFIACRNCNYVMIKFLHSISTNFHIKNKQGENALQVMAASNRKSKHIEFYECFSYLILTVKIDILYNYEETLLLLDDEKAISFYEKKLEEFGIFFKKKDVEDIYKNYSMCVNASSKMKENSEQNSPTEEKNYDCKMSFISSLSKATIFGTSFVSSSST